MILPSGDKGKNIVNKNKKKKLEASLKDKDYSNLRKLVKKTGRKEKEKKKKERNKTKAIQKTKTSICTLTNKQKQFKKKEKKSKQSNNFF